MAAATSTPASSVLAALRAATTEAHQDLDRRLALDAETLTPDGYVRFLRASSAVAAPVEAAIARWLGAPSVSRASALHADLVALGSSLAPPAAVPELHSLAEAMGAAYVVEGSALGGSVLARTVAKALGDAAPRSYLTLRGEHTGERWREFVQSLEAWGGAAPEPARLAACEVARATFAAYASAFERAGAFC